jgi:hypothetical protein
MNTDEMRTLIENLAELFGEADDMSQMDAADFKDNAGTIWNLRQRARNMVQSEAENHGDH